LIEILAEAALDDLLHEQAGLDERPSRGEPDSDTRVIRKQRRPKRSRT
jgi:hypothetical protein